MFGMPVKSVFSRLYLRYSLENVSIKDLNLEFYDPETIARYPYLADALLIRPDGTLGGRRIISKVTPSYVYNTVDNPIFPSAGMRFTASIDLAGLGGNTNYYKPTVELIKYFQHTRRTSFGIRTQFEYAEPIGATEALPFFERLVLGGEYSVRGYDVRSIGPLRPHVGPGARRQQEPAVQRRISDSGGRTGPAGDVLRRRPGARRGPEASG